MNSNPAISVVVPVYNVSAYLEQCVASILKQSFGDFELLLIDDGSTDDSGKLCEKLAAGDARIRCFHKPNGGLSDARNFGIERIRGTFVTFIDSDDWVEPEYLEYLFASFAQNREVDISTCVFTYRRGESSQPWRNFTAEPEIMSGKEALLSMLYDERVNVSAHGKLYRSSLFEGIRYPVGKRYEDVGTTYKLLQKACKVAVGGNPLYDYRMREGSITHSSSKGAFDRIELAQRAYKDLFGNDEELNRAAERYLVFHSLSVLHLCDFSDDEQRIRAYKLRKDVLNRKKRILSDPRTPRRDRFALRALTLGLFPYRAIWSAYAVLTGR